jgi:hypothetical protein
MLDMTEGGGAEAAGGGKTPVSLAMTPIPFKSIFEEQMGPSMDAEFLCQLAHFNGRLVAAGLSSMAHPAENNKA